MNTTLLANYLKQGLEKRGIEVTDEKASDVIFEVIQLYETITDDEKEDNYFNNYAVSNYLSELTQNKELILDYFNIIKLEEDKETYLLGAYEKYKEDFGNTESKYFHFVETFCDYYIQKCLLNDIWDVEKMTRCLLFKISCSTEQDLRCLKEIAIRETELLKKKSYYENSYRSYRVILKMEEYQDLDCFDIEAATGGTIPFGYHCSLENMMEYTFDILFSDFEHIHLEKNLKKLFPRAIIEVNEIKEPKRISRQFFESIYMYTYNKIRGFNTKDLNYKGKSSLRDDIEDCIKEVLEMYNKDTDIYSNFDSKKYDEIGVEDILEDAEPIEDIFAPKPLTVEELFENDDLSNVTSKDINEFFKDDLSDVTEKDIDELLSGD